MTQCRLDNDRLLWCLARLGDFCVLADRLEISAVTGAQVIAWAEFTAAGE